MRGFAPLVRPKVWPGSYRINADVGRNLWIHIEGEIATTPNGTMLTGELSKGLGWRVFSIAAVVVSATGFVGLIASWFRGPGDEFLPLLLLAFGFPGLTWVAYLRIGRTHRALVRRLANAVQGRVHASSDID